MERLKQDRLKLDDPTCSQYQIILDLMGKDESQLAKDRHEQMIRLRHESMMKAYNEKRRLEDGQASAYLISHSDDNDTSQKQLLFTVPEHPKPKFLSQTSMLQQLLLKEAEQLGDKQEDNSYIFEEVIRNDLIREEFEKIRSMYGEEAYELNKLSLLNFIKKGKQNYTYSVKYYGVNEGQIGILSRKVPYDDGLKKPLKTFRLPKLVQDANVAPKDIYEYVEVEESDMEEVSIEVEQSDDDIVPTAVRPNQAKLDIVQGSIGGHEFKEVKKDNNPLEASQNPQIITTEEKKKKKMKRIKEKRRVKKKRIVKQLKPQSRLDNESQFGETYTMQNIINFSDNEQTLEPESRRHINQREGEFKALTRVRSQPQFKIRETSQRQKLHNPDDGMKDLQDVMDKGTPFMINFRELFKKVELQNLKEFKRPEPEKYDQHIVHSYSLPKGLHATRKIQVLSEAEMIDRERYSKRNVQLHMIDKVYQKMNLGGQTYGLKGSKVKPLYFNINHSNTQQLPNTQGLHQSQSQSQIQDVSKDIPVKIQPIKVPHKNTTIPSINTSVNQSNNVNLIGNKITTDYTQPKSSARTGQINNPIYDHGDTKTPINIEIDSSKDNDKEAHNQSDSSMLNQAYNLYNFGKGGSDFTMASHEVSSFNPNKMLIGKSIRVQDQTHTLVSINPNNTSKLQNQKTKKNNQIIKNLARNKKLAYPSHLDDNFQPQLGQISIFNQPNNLLQKPPKLNMMRHASEGQLKYGFQISNQMKISYLMDTKKILHGSSKKAGQDSDSDDDKIILNEKEVPIKEAGKIVLPKISNSIFGMKANSYQPSVASTNIENNLQLRRISLTAMDFNSTYKSQSSIHQSPINLSNVKIVCRIRPPKKHRSRNMNKQVAYQPPEPTSYNSVRNKSRSTSRDFSSPFRNQLSGRLGHKECLKNQNSSSRDTSRNRSSHSRRKSKSLINNSGFIHPDKKYCIFTTKERSNLVLTTENPIPGKVVNETLIEQSDLKYFKQSLALFTVFSSNLLGEGQTEIFNFDSVFNESIRQDRFYSSVVGPTVKNFVEGQNASVILFGPTEGGKTYTLKGKTGIERGIMPRAIEDIFNIIRNSERREEELQALNQRMMESDDDGDQLYPESQNFSKTYQTARGVTFTDDPSQERMFLKVKVFQIFIDKTIDLLTSTSDYQRGQIDQFIERDTNEVVSKLANITEKTVFSVEDFYGVLQEAFKNRTLKSAKYQDYDLRKKAHFIIGLTLMRRTHDRKLMEVSSLNFVELAGSEQAVADDSHDTNVKNFVTRSFNGISSQILKSALKKRVNNHEDNEAKLINCIRNTLTQQSNIVLICNVNPSPESFEHSLPALKFCARIRDYIVKKHKVSSSQRSIMDQDSESVNESIEQDRDYKAYRTNNTQKENQYQTSRDQIRDLSYSRQLLKETIDIMKEDLATKQLQSNQMSPYELDTWIMQKLEDVNRLSTRVEDDRIIGQDQKGKLLLSQELQFLKDTLQKMREQQRSETIRSPTRYTSQQFNLERVPVGDYKTYERENETYGRRGHIYEADYSSSHRDKPYELTSKYPDTIYSPTQNRTVLRPHQLQNTFRSTYQTQEERPYNHTYNDYQSLKSPRQHDDLNTYKPPTAEFNNQTTAITQDKDVQLYKRSPTFSDLNPRYHTEHNSRRDSGHSEVSNIRSENDFLNKRHPLLEKDLIGKQNSIENNRDHSPSQIKQEPMSYTVKGHRALPPSQAHLLSKNNVQGQQQDQPQPTLKNPLSSYFHQQVKSPTKANSTYNPFRFNATVNEPVYPSQEELVNDINRLIKLGDHEGIKVRLVQLYKEREQSDNERKEQEKQIQVMNEELKAKTELLEEQDKVILNAHQDFQNQIDALNQQSLTSERSTNQKALSLAEHMKDFQAKILELEREKDKLLKAQEILETENKELIRLRQESDAQAVKHREENEKLKTNYEILKEHEMSLIKDFEGKKTREITFYEQRIVEMHQIQQEERSRIKGLEEQVHGLKEQMTRNAYEMEKIISDKNHALDQIEELKVRLSDEKLNQQELQNQIHQLESEYAKMEQVRDTIECDKQRAQDEIAKLHQLIEEMDKATVREQSSNAELKQTLTEKETLIQEYEKNKCDREKQIEIKDTQIVELNQREEDYKKQLSQMAKMNEDLEKQLTMIKAKEYDKLDHLKRAAELEARIKYLAVDNETLVRERNNLDIANVTLQAEKQQLSEALAQAEEELAMFKEAHDQHLDKFDQKFDQISNELTKLKQENIQLKERERASKLKFKELEEERDELMDRVKLSERRRTELEVKMGEIEREMREIMHERERDVKDNFMKTQVENKFKEENRTKMLDDIQNMIKQYKHEKVFQKTEPKTFQGYSTNSSGYL